jgi:polysaccharide biosynthesis/export protein
VPGRKMSVLFNEISRIMASPISRRQALSRVRGAGEGAVWASLGLARTFWGQKELAMSAVEAKSQEWVLTTMKRLGQLGWAMFLGGLICQAPRLSAEEPTFTRLASPISASRPAAVSASPNNCVGPSYLIAQGDLLDIYIVGVQELSREYRVNGDGLITLPMLSHPVMAAGLTLDQLSMAIRKELVDGGLLTDPQIVVSVKSSTVNSVVLAGAVKKPGVYPIYGHTTLLELLTQSEGLSDDAGNIAIVTRGEKALAGRDLDATQAADDANRVVPRTVKIDVLRLWQNGDTSLNVELYPGDRVTVQRAGIVYVMGAVNRAGGFVLSSDQQQMTVLKAVALAGSFTQDAKPTKAVIIRKTAQAPSDEEIPIDLKKVLSKHSPDERLLANDILYIPESGGKRTLRKVIDSTLYTTIWHLPY